MDVVRSVLVVIHLATLVGLSLGSVALLVGFAPPGSSRAVVVASAVMGLSGLALIGVRSALGLDVNALKLAVKAGVLVGVLVLARLLARDGSDDRRLRRAAGGIVGLLIADTAIAFGWA